MKWNFKIGSGILTVSITVLLPELFNSIQQVAQEANYLICQLCSKLFC